MFQYLGLVLAIMSWIAGGYLVTKWRDKKLKTISEHAASHKHASILFAAVLVLGGGVLYWWLVAWFTPHLQLGSFFLVLLSFTTLCQLIAGIVPDSTGHRQLIHRGAAWEMAVLYLPLVGCVLQAPSITPIAQIIGTILLLYMVTAFTLTVVLRKFKQHFLAFQTSYIIAFQLIILSAAYL